MVDGESPAVGNDLRTATNQGLPQPVCALVVREREEGAAVVEHSTTGVSYVFTYCRPTWWITEVGEPALPADLSAVGRVARVICASRLGRDSSRVGRTFLMTRTLRPSTTQSPPERRTQHLRRRRKDASPRTLSFSRYCWIRSTSGMMTGGCASSMPSSSMIGPR